MIYFYSNEFDPMTKEQLEIIENICNKMNEEDKFILSITDFEDKKYTNEYYGINGRKRKVYENIKRFGFKSHSGSKDRFIILRQVEKTSDFLAHCTLLKDYIYRNDFVILLDQDRYKNNI